MTEGKAQNDKFYSDTNKFLEHKKMLKHIVMWKLKSDNKTENIKLMSEKLKSLKGKIDCIQDFEVGFSCESGGKIGIFDIVLVSSFKDKNDLEKYQKDEEHLKVGEFIKSVVEGRAVVDYEI